MLQQTLAWQEASQQGSNQVLFSLHHHTDLPARQPPCHLKPASLFYLRS